MTKLERLRKERDKADDARTEALDRWSKAIYACEDAKDAHGKARDTHLDALGAFFAEEAKEKP